MRIDESTGVDRQKAAREILTLREAELINESVHGPAAVRTFADAAHSYVLADGEVTHLPPLIRHFGSVKLARIGQEQIDVAARKLGAGKSPATLNRQIYTPMAAVLNHAARMKWCSKPVIARPKQPLGRVRWISYEEADRMIECAAPHLRALVVFLLSTGARASEALYLDWRQVDLDARRVEFLETKNRERRGVTLHERVVRELEAMPHRSGPVFRRPDGCGYADRHGEGGGQVKKAWATMCRRASITDFSPHDCRHTFATWHYRANRDLTALQKLGGWKTVEMVLRYAHTNPDELAPTIDRVWGISGETEAKAA
ncbi:MAG: site-specific integrase [Brevundimonas sp.]|uniref:tyrosine-type recombinase/integrase n=1 Tax=Brevundimonas sp. TaxID=1871086 RepID=UPI003564B490